MSCLFDIILNLLCSISQCKFRMPFAPSKYTQILLKVQVQLKHAVMNPAQSKQKTGLFGGREVVTFGKRERTQ